MFEVLGAAKKVFCNHVKHSQEEASSELHEPSCLFLPPFLFNHHVVGVCFFSRTRRFSMLWFSEKQDPWKGQAPPKRVPLFVAMGTGEISHQLAFYEIGDPRNGVL